MDAMQFARRAKEDPQLRPFLQEVADDVDKQVSVEEPEQFTVTGVDFLFFVAAYALFRWLKDYFDRRKEMYVTEMVERQADVVVALTKEGIPPKVAQAVVVVEHVRAEGPASTAGSTPLGG